MQLEHSFTVPVDAETAWQVLRDIERIAPCMPGATIESVEGDDFTGRVKVKVGPMQITYRGDASFVEVDDEAHRATIEARGRETRGSGTANADITARLSTPQEGSTLVEIVTDLNVTGKPAQFGRGVMADVGQKLIDQFAECLSEQLAGGDDEQATDAVVHDAAGDEPGASVAGGIVATDPDDGSPRTDAPQRPAGTAGAAGPTDGQMRGQPVGSAAPPRPGDDAIDLLDVAGGPVAKRAAPVLGVLLVLALVWWLRRR